MQNMQNMQNMQSKTPEAGEALGPLPHTRIVPKRRQLPPVVASVRRFHGQLENERIVAIRRPSLLLAVGPCLPLAIGLFGAILWYHATNRLETFTFLASLALILISAPLAFKYVSTWLGRVFIVTDRRVLLQLGILHQQVEQVELANIVQVLVDRPNFLQMLLGMGTVAVRPLGTPLRLRGVSHPRDFADTILTVREQNAMMLAALPPKPVVRNQRLQAAIDALEQPAAEPVYTPLVRPPLGGFLHRKLPVRLLVNESVVELVYRHWIVLLRRELPALALVAATILAYIGVRTIAPSGAAPLVSMLLGLLVTLAYMVLTYIDWADDVFILTTHRVIDIDRIFWLLAEYSNEALHNKIQDVKVEQGFWGHVFGYGSIKVEIAGADRPMEMRNIPDAKGLMNRIFAQVEMVRRRDVNAARNKQRLETSRWISQVLDELMIQVPDVTDLPLLRAAARVRKAGLRLSVDGERPVAGVPSGIVLEQAPLPGNMALAEDGVHVVISGQSQSS